MLFGKNIIYYYYYYQLDIPWFTFNGPHQNEAKNGWEKNYKTKVINQNTNA